MSQCSICGIRFSDFLAYDNHRKNNHMPKIVPLNTSGRTARQIIDNAEATWLKPFIVDSVHDADCRCNSCFQKALDRLLESSEKHLGGLE